MADQSVTWTIAVSRDTDQSVRSFLADHGMEASDLPKFIEECVRNHVFDVTLAEVRARFSDMPSEEIEALVDEAVTAVRQAARTAAE